MALKSRSLFLYGYQVTELNRSIDFKTSLGGPTKMASLTLGFYSLSTLLTEAKRAMEAVESTDKFTWTADRTIAGGTENRVKVQSDGTYLELLFETGPRAASALAPLIGFDAVDRSGATFYWGNATSGITLLTDPDFLGYAYTPPTLFKKKFGVRNVSGSGKPEAVVFNSQSFWEVGFKYIEAAAAENEWAPLLDWLTGQRRVEFTPEISTPTKFHVGTLESSPEDNVGMGYKLREQRDESLFDLYDTGLMKFRVTE